MVFAPAMNTFLTILPWVTTVIFAGTTIFLFLQLKKINTQMMKALFPKAKNMNEVMSQMQGMQGMMQNLQRGGSRGPGVPNLSGMGGKNMDAQLKQAMDMLSRLPKK